jgi:hypothetical protein
MHTDALSLERDGLGEEVLHAVKDPADRRLAAVELLGAHQPDARVARNRRARLDVWDRDGHSFIQ